MADTVDAATRSRIMSSVPQRDTVPELKVRSALHKLGYRFRVARRDLPGCPDIVLPKHQIVVMVHGCFWHQHKGCRRAARPKANARYWSAKLDRNVARDRENAKALQVLGWNVLVVWECETGDVSELEKRLPRMLQRARKATESLQYERKALPAPHQKRGKRGIFSVRLHTECTMREKENNALERMTVMQLVDLYNSYGPARRLRAWKGRKADLVARVRVAAKQSTPDGIVEGVNIHVPS